MKETDVENRELREYGIELFIKRVLGELDFSHVEVANATNFEVFMNNL